MSSSPFDRYGILFLERPEESLSEDFPFGYRVADAFLWPAAELIKTASPGADRLATYHLWWRARVLLSDAIRIFGTEATTALEFLGRAMSELTLHLSILSEPTRAKEAAAGPFAELSSLKTEERVRERLKGYLAWVLHGEIRAIHRLLSPKNMRMIFEAETARDLARAREDDASERPGLAALVEGPAETLTDAEAEQERRQAEKSAKARLQRLKELYGAEDLSYWRKLLEGAKSHVALDALLDHQPEKKSSIMASWEPAGMGIGRIAYDHVSGVLHGSALWPVYVYEQLVAVERPKDPEDAEQTFGSTARLAALHIYQLAGRLPTTG